MSFKQKLAKFLSKSKHFKNISFVQKFIEKNKVISNNEKTANVSVKNTATQLYKVNPQQAHYTIKKQDRTKTKTPN